MSVALASTAWQATHCTTRAPCSDEAGIDNITFGIFGCIVSYAACCGVRFPAAVSNPQNLQLGECTRQVKGCAGRTPLPLFAFWLYSAPRLFSLQCAAAYSSCHFWLSTAKLSCAVAAALRWTSSSGVLHVLPQSM